MKKKRFRRFDEGGAALEDFEDKTLKKRPADLEDFEDKYLPSSKTSSTPPGGRFSSDVYDRAAKAVSEREARAAANAAVSNVGAGGGRGGRGGPTAQEMASSTAPMRGTPAAPQGRAEIPTGGGYPAPASTGEMPGEFERNVRNTLSAMTPGAVGLGAKVATGLATPAVKGWQAGQAERAGAMAAKEFSKPQARQAAQSAQRFSPAQEVEAAESAARGAASRKGVQAKRAERSQAAKDREQAKFDAMMEGRRQARVKDIMERGVSPEGYARGGSVSAASRRGDGIAQRGKTRGTMVACGGGYMKGKK